MARGFLSGVIWGVFVSGVGLGGLSLATDPPIPPKVPGDLADAPESAQTTPAPVDQAAMPAAATDAEPDRAGAPDPMETPTEDVVTPDADSSSAAPDPETDIDRLDDPAADAEAPDTGSRPDRQPDVAETPEMTEPNTDTVAEVDAVPAMPVAPVETQDDVAATLPEPEVGGAPSEPSTSSDATPVAPQPVPVAPAPTVEDAPVVSSEVTAPPKPDATATAPDTSEEPRFPQAGTEETAAPEEEVAILTPRIGQPAGQLEDAPGVAKGRLPSVGASDNSTDPTMQVSQPPLIANSEPVDVAPDSPLMSIILIDDGRSPIGPEALDAFPYPLTFAVDVTRDDATEAMQTYRDKGFEVVAMASLPERAIATDAEVGLTAALAAVPNSVAVMETPEGGLQTSREATDQVTQILQSQGYGLILFPKGLNTAEALARKNGVKAVTVFRDLDGKDQDPKTIRRFLDNAAMRAGQGEGVVMVGRVRADTISALLLWGLQDRASSVALVPVSKILMASE